MNCTACNKILMRKETLYTSDKAPYCNNPMTCNDLHPNSAPNIIARNGAIKMLTEDQLESDLFDNLIVSEEMKDRILKVATKPQSIRLSKVDIAYYLVQLQESKQFNSLSECIRYCVSIAMKQEPVESLNKPHALVSEPIKPEGIQVVVPEVKPEKQPEEETTFTF